MIKKILIILIVILLLPSIVVMAYDVSQAQYITEMIATNAAASTKTNVITTVNLSSPDLVSSGMIAATVDDAVLIAGAVDIPFMPGYDSNPWLFFVDSIPASSSENYYLYTGGATGGKIVYYPDTSGMTISDNTTIELDNNFSVNQSGWFDATTANYTFNKASAFNIYGNGSGNYTATIPEFSDSVVLPVDGAGSLTDIPTLFGAATHWQACLTIDDATSYVEQGAAHYDTDLFTATDSTINTNTIIDDVTITYRLYDNKGRSVLRTHAVDYLGAEKTPGGAWTTYTTVYTDNPNTTTTWTWAEVNDMEIGVSLLWDGGANAMCTYVSATVNYHFAEVAATVSGISSGEHDFIASANTTHLTLDIDGSTNSAALNGASVPDNANDIVSCAGGSLLYLEYLEINISGVQECYIDWEYGTTFTDSSGNSNDATPTFRTTSSDADVTVSIYSQSSTDEQGMPPVAETGGFTMIGDTPSTPSGLFDSGGTTFPGSAQIADLATATRISYTAWCYIFAFLSAILAGLGVFGLTHRIKLGIRGSMLLMTITMVVVLCFWIFGGGGVISGFVQIPFVLIMLFLLMIRNPQSPVVG